MPWKETTTMSERKEFIREALKGEGSISALCQEYGISRKTGYKWLKRYREEGISGLADQSRNTAQSRKHSGSGWPLQHQPQKLLRSGKGAALPTTRRWAKSAASQAF